MRPSLRQVLFRSAAGLDLNFAGGAFSLNNTRSTSPAAIPGWSFSRTDTNGTATALDLAGNVIQFATGVPRITNRGILVEEARTNLLLWSRDFTQSSWTKISGATAPSANTVSLTAGYQSRIEQIISVNTGQSAVFQCRLSGSGDIRLSIVDNGGVFGNTYIDVTLTATPTTYSVVRTIGGSGLTSCIARLSTAAAGAAVTATADYADAGLGAFATSPIITTGAAGTRGADVASIPFSPDSVGTALAEWLGTLATASPRIIGSSTSNRTLLYQDQAGAPNGGVGTYNGTTVLLRTPNITAGAVAKAGVTWASGRRAVTANGAAVATDANAIGAFTTMQIGNDTGSTGFLNSYIRRIRILPTAATDAQLQALTAP